MPRDIGGELFRNVAKALIILYKSEQKGYIPTVSDFLDESRINRTTFFQHLKRNLEKAGWVEFRVNPDRTITMHLTQKGRKIAQALASIEKELKEAGVV